MNIAEIFTKYYPSDSLAHHIVYNHGRAVAQKALEIAGNLDYTPNLQLIEEAAILHDIGVIFSDLPHIGCFGDKPYVCHGILGAELLMKEGYPKHALICERHIGMGLSLNEIIDQDLPLPHREMQPQTIEEKIVCLADKFFSKNPNALYREKELEQIRRQLGKFGKIQVERFNQLIIEFDL